MPSTAVTSIKTILSALVRAPCVLAGIGWLFGASAALALDTDRLWLPKKYRVHYLELRDAAEIVELSDRCAEILRGTIDQDLSDEGAPVFRFLCRDDQSHTFSELVDGDSMTLRSAAVKAAPPETAREREARLAAEAQAEAEAAAAAEQQAAEQARAQAAAEQRAVEQAQREKEIEQQKARELAQRRQVFEEICRTEMRAKTAMMINLSWLSEKPAVEELDNGQLRFTADFDAENMWGRTLHYRAVCTISTPDELVVVLSAR